MKIIKWKKIAGNKYEMILDNNETIILYEDIILKNQLLWKKEINDLELLEKENNEYEIMDKALKYLDHHVCCHQNIKEYLSKYCASSSLLDNVIKTLDGKGYLNDKNYAKAYINDQFNLSQNGPLKIIKHLDRMQIDKSIYESILENYSKDFFYDRINKYIMKHEKSNHQSNYLFKVKMKNNLINLGYYMDDIDDCLNNYAFNDSNNYLKTKDKLYKKLSKKYEGKDLERKVEEKLFRQGFFRD